MDLIWIFLPFILALGIITSYEDIKFSKIRNKWVISAVVLSIIIHPILFFYGMIDAAYIIRISLFVIFSFIIGFLMYLMGLWSPGDAKLFTAFVSLFPLVLYRYVTTSFWPLAILVNTFVPVFVYLVAFMLVKSSLRQKVLVLKSIMHPRRIAEYMLVIFSVGWVVELVFGYLIFRTNLLLNIIMITGIFAALKKIFPYELNYLLGFVSVIRVFVKKDLMMSWGFWYGFLVMTLSYMLVMMFIRELSWIFTKKANINYLKEGMIPVEGIIKMKEVYGKKFFGGKEQEDYTLVYRNKAGGLDKDDIEHIQGLHRSGKLHFNHILIQQTLPFAVFIFAGVLLAVLAKGDFVLFLRALI